MTFSDASRSPYSYREENTALGTAAMRGRFATLGEAVAAAQREAKNSRAFVRFTIYQNGYPVGEAPEIRGES